MIHPTRILLTATLGLIMSAIGGPAATVAPTPPSYTLTEIAPGQNFSGLYMNSFGEIAGFIPANNPSLNPGAMHAAIYVGGKILDLGAKLNPAIESFASFINLQGEVLIVTSADGNFTGYTFKNGRFTPVTFPSGASMNEFTGLNDFGFAVGNFLDPTSVGGSVSGFLLAPDGALVKLPIVPVGAFCINDVGQIIGQFRTLMSAALNIRDPGGRLIPINAASSQGAINQLGYVCGGNLLYANNTIINLGYLPGYPPVSYITPDGSVITDYEASSVNDFGIVVGGVDSNIGAGFSTGWVFTAGQMYDLTKSIQPQYGFTVLGAKTILDDGRILAIGTLMQTGEERHTIILTPVTKKP